MVKAARIDGFLRIPPEIDDVHDGFEHRVDDGPSAGGLPVTMKRRPSFTTMVGDMLESMRLPGCARFAGVPIRPSAVVRPGAALKSQFRCSAETRPPGNDLRAVCLFERVRHRDGVAIRVDHCQVRRLAAVLRSLEGRGG